MARGVTGFLAISLIGIVATAAQATHQLNDRNIERGQALYGEHCGSCHGVELQGQADWRSPDENGILPAPPHDETGHTWHHDNGLLFDYTKFGGQEALARRGMVDFKSGMPGFAEVLNDNEIWDILAFIRSTWPERIQAMHSMRNPPHD